MLAIAARVSLRVRCRPWQAGDEERPLIFGIAILDPRTQVLLGELRGGFAAAELEALRNHQAAVDLAATRPIAPD